MSDVASSQYCRDNNCATLSEGVLLDLAFYLGLDTSKGYEFKTGVHRTLHNKLDGGLYLVANERLDKGWLTSGYATTEAIIYNERDKGFRKELDRMQNNRGNPLFKAIDHKLKFKELKKA